MGLGLGFGVDDLAVLRVPAGAAAAQAAAAQAAAEEDKEASRRVHASRHMPVAESPYI